MKPNHHSQSGPGHLRLVAWEITRNCNLSCIHCRASATKGPYLGELDTDFCFKVIDEIASVGNPIVILTGGEPLLRNDIFEIAAYGTSKGLKMVMAPNGTLITKDIAEKMVASGIKRISISIDGPNKESHDSFRGVTGAFEGAMRGIEIAKSAGIEFQLNTTITKLNFEKFPDILELAVNLGAAAHHIFLLVPTGRGKYIFDNSISSEEYEKTLNWFYEQRSKINLQLKATCAPHYYRILRQRAAKEGKSVNFETYGLDAVTRGCLGGTSFCFISHVGVVQPCGFLDLNCGNVKETPFSKIWSDSSIFLSLRDFSNLKGKCGRCEFKKVCGGCRARAYEVTGDYLDEEPLCIYQPN
ncbi:MAG: heme b synthase [Desulfobacterales bacterium]|nr:heme b synthase [Desulfobacterales bacterium]